MPALVPPTEDWHRGAWAAWAWGSPASPRSLAPARQLCGPCAAGRVWGAPGCGPGVRTCVWVRARGPVPSSAPPTSRPLLPTAPPGLRQWPLSARRPFPGPWVSAQALHSPAEERGPSVASEASSGPAGPRGLSSHPLLYRR